MACIADARSHSQDRNARLRATLDAVLELDRAKFGTDADPLPLLEFFQNLSSPTRPPPPIPLPAVLSQIFPIKRSTMAPAQAQPSQAPASGQANDSANSVNGSAGHVGPPPSFIYVAKRFIFQQQLQTHMIAIGNNPTREDNYRLQGVQWINDVRKALSL
jgi:hypothetical protein